MPGTDYAGHVPLTIIPDKGQISNHKISQNNRRTDDKTTKNHASNDRKIFREQVLPDTSHKKEFRTKRQKSKFRISTKKPDRKQGAPKRPKIEQPKNFSRPESIGAVHTKPNSTKKPKISAPDMAPKAPQKKISEETPKSKPRKNPTRRDRYLRGHGMT